MTKFCSHCGMDCKTVREPGTDKICCSECGKVIEDSIYAEGPMFEKGADGSSRMSGASVSHASSDENFDRRRDRGKQEIDKIAINLGIATAPGSAVSERAQRFYKLALDRNFTKGRSVENVAAACLYLACRNDNRPYLLIDFSDKLGVTVYVLGAVFLQLCQTLMLMDNSLVKNVILDPSIFIHRYTARLLNEQNKDVSGTALRLIAGMKRDWMQTGRKPTGLCAAALYVSVQSRGLNHSILDIIRVVPVSEATVMKRLTELMDTESGTLTIDEFLERAKELDEESQNRLARPGKLQCQHANEEHFACGLCRKCYDEFEKISGGLHDGSDPPAFQRAERQREHEANLEERGDEDVEFSLITDSNAKENSFVSTKVASRAENDDVEASVGNTSENLERRDESDDLNDIDDIEVDGYINDEVETQKRKQIWEELNKDYEEKQAEKKAAAEKELSSGKLKKERKKRQAKETLKSKPAGTTFDAVNELLSRKVSSKRLNRMAMENLFPDSHRKNENLRGEECEDDSRKKQRTGPSTSEAEDLKNEGDMDNDEANVDGDGTGDWDGDEYAYDGDGYGYDGDGYGYDDADGKDDGIDFF